MDYLLLLPAAHRAALRAHPRVVRVRIERVGEPAGHQSPVGAEVGARLAGFAGFGIVSLPRVNTWI